MGVKGSEVVVVGGGRDIVSVIGEGGFSGGMVME